MISLTAALSSRWFAWGLAGVVIALIVLALLWHKHFQKETEAALSISTLLEAVSIGVTAVSILLPATAALLIYYLSRITKDALLTTHPLVVALFFLGGSLLIGLLNAFSFATEYPGGVKVIWTRTSWGRALWFGAQFILFATAVVMIVLFFLFTPVDVTDALNKS